MRVRTNRSQRRHLFYLETWLIMFWNERPCFVILSRWFIILFMCNNVLFCLRLIFRIKNIIYSILKSCVLIQYIWWKRFLHLNVILLFKFPPDDNDFFIELQLRISEITSVHLKKKKNIFETLNVFVIFFMFASDSRVEGRHPFPWLLLLGWGRRRPHYCERMVRTGRYSVSSSPRPSAELFGSGDDASTAPLSVSDVFCTLFLTLYFPPYIRLWEVNTSAFIPRSTRTSCTLINHRCFTIPVR